MFDIRNSHGIKHHASGQLEALPQAEPLGFRLVQPVLPNNLGVGGGLEFVENVVLMVLVLLPGLGDLRPPPHHHASDFILFGLLGQVDTQGPEGLRVNCLQGVHHLLCLLHCGIFVLAFHHVLAVVDSPQAELSWEMRQQIVQHFSLVFCLLEGLFKFDQEVQHAGLLLFWDFFAASCLHLHGLVLGCFLLFESIHSIVRFVGLLAQFDFAQVVHKGRHIPNVVEPASQAGVLFPELGRNHQDESPLQGAAEGDVGEGEAIAHQECPHLETVVEDLEHLLELLEGVGELGLAEGDLKVGLAVNLGDQRQELIVEVLEPGVHLHLLVKGGAGELGVVGEVQGDGVGFVEDEGALVVDDGGEPAGDLGGAESVIEQAGEDPELGQMRVLLLGVVKS